MVKNGFIAYGRNKLLSNTKLQYNLRPSRTHLTFIRCLCFKRTTLRHEHDDPISAPFSFLHHFWPQRASEMLRRHYNTIDSTYYQLERLLTTVGNMQFPGLFSFLQRCKDFRKRDQEINIFKYHTNSVNCTNSAWLFKSEPICYHGRDIENKIIVV